MKRSNTETRFETEYRCNHSGKHNIWWLIFLLYQYNIMPVNDTFKKVIQIVIGKCKYIGTFGNK